MKSGLLALALLTLAGCGSSTATPDEIRQALLVEERVRLADTASGANLDTVAIRDVIVHGSTPIATVTKLR